MRPVGELGDARWKILLQLKTWLRILQCCLSLVMFLPCFLFDEQARVYVENTDFSFNITVRFPFSSDNTTVTYSGQDAPSSFTFDPEIAICVWIFVVDAIATLLTAILILALHMSIYGCHEGDKIHIVDMVISAVTSFFLLLFSSFWLYNMIGMISDVDKESSSAYSKITSSGYCDDSKYKCVKKLPNYLSLYISVGAAYFNAVVCILNCLSIYRFLRSPYTPPSNDDGQQNYLVNETELEASLPDQSTG